MKKVLILFAVVAFSMSLGVSAFAQEIACPPCKGFDWEDHSFACPTDEQDTCPSRGIMWEEFVFPICNCPDVDINFAKGSRVGIRMHILTEGVYWADRADWAGLEDVAGLDFLAYDSNADACAPVTTQHMGTFSQIVFWPDSSCNPNEIDTPDDPAHTDCTWDLIDHNKLKVLGTNPAVESAFFTIPDNIDADGNEIPGILDWTGYSYWVFDPASMPNIRIDTEEVLAAGLRGEPIQIRVQFVKPGDEGICTGDCLVICECIIEVMMLCDPEYGCIYFPYVLTQRSPWVTGVALSNIGGNIPISDMEATFTLTDMAGNEFTYVKDDFENAVWSNVLDNMLDEFDGTPTPGNAFLRIDTNFYTDGYQFITDGVFGGSSLARECDFVCNQNTPCH